jgi:hypothetical protein
MKRLPTSIRVVSVGLLALTAGLATLAGCGTTPASQPGEFAASTPPASTPASGGSSPATSPSTPAASSATPPASWSCAAAGSYLTAVRVGQHADFDRVVFQFSGGVPVYRTEAVRTVYSDPKGTPVRLAGQQSLRVVFRASAWCQQPVRRTYTGPPVLTPFYPRLLVVSAAGDFERVLSFGIGTAASGPYRVYSLTGPDRVVIDFTHVAAGSSR